MTQKRDDEKGQLAIGGGIFTAVLIVVDLLFAGPIFGTILFSTLFIIVHGILGICWVVAISKFNDPNYDYWRKWAIYVAIAGLALVLGYLAYENEMGAVIDDSNKAKQEQTP
jgi:hypothetical protein